MATTLFFDLDGTLMTNPFWKVVFPQVTESLAQQTGKTPQAMFEIIMAEHDRRLQHPLEDRPLTMDWEDIFAAVARAYHAQVTLSAEALVIAHAAPPNSEALDKAPDVLRRLRQSGGRKLVAASMGLSKYQFPVMKALGLYDCFDDFLMPDTTGYLKTERGFYGDYLYQPDLRIHIGDRYDHDCYFPKNLGARVVMRLPFSELAAPDPFDRPRYLDKLKGRISGLVNGGIPVLPDAVVIHLRELEKVIGRMEAG
jgi:FMN phosphatase YigB (HAD superfamily)